MSAKSTSEFQLAQANVAHMRYAMDDPRMAGFTARLEPLNALADQSDGFIWRYETPEGDATEAEVFGDERVLFNLSVWASVAALEAYVYRSAHVAAVQKRGSWFERATRSPVVLWWIPAGHRPSVQEAKRRFDTLWTLGPTADAFTFREQYPEPQTASALSVAQP
ncbi:MAG: DUF3291 domain-containing protein [Gammaproteobacteria bacterium]|nr:DUF3291 domain-containing protein [Gammaproteobacteria bacterium]